MSKVKIFAKDDYESLPYTADYTAELTATGDDISSSYWIIPSDSAEAISAVQLKDGVTVNYDITNPSPKYRSGVSSAVTINSKKTSIEIVGGTLGSTYRIMNRITTVLGHQYSRVADIYIQRKSEC